MGDVVRLEEFTGRLNRKISVVFEGSGGAGGTPGTSGWLPTEFMAAQYITRILIAGRSSPTSATLASSPDWTQIWRAPGSTEWSCLLGILGHLGGPILIVVAPDVGMSPKILGALKGTTATSDTTVILLRSPSYDASTASYATAKAYASQSSTLSFIDHLDHTCQVFFPVMDGTSKASHLIMNHLNDWIGRVALDIKAVLPSLASAGYGLTITDGTWYWYNPGESPPLSSLTLAQLGRQIQVLGSLVEGASERDGRV